MDNPGEWLGALIAVLLLSCPAVYFLVAAFYAGPRSRRLANLALCFGLTTFTLPEAVLRVSSAVRPNLFLASGVIRLSLGLFGLALAAVAFFKRRDGGTGVGRPIVGAGFCLLHIAVGVGMLSFNFMSRPSASWVYVSPDATYSITLPSKEWSQFAKTGGVGIVAFGRPAPRMLASVVSVQRDQTEADLDRTAEAFRARIEADPKARGQVQFRSGMNGAGNPYRYCTAIDSGPDGKPVFVAYSVTWCPSKWIIVEVFFEGQPAMRSRTGQAAETDLFEKSAETICLSVE
jgi:hypothetical protein